DGVVTAGDSDPATETMLAELRSVLPGSVRVSARSVLDADSATFGPPQWDEITDAVAEVLADPGVSGVVVAHGTDTLEETAMALDLHHRDPRPVAVTGAQLPADHPEADGPANLLDAVLLAADPVSRDLGVLVVLGRAILPARGRPRQPPLRRPPGGRPRLPGPRRAGGSRARHPPGPRRPKMAPHRARRLCPQRPRSSRRRAAPRAREAGPARSRAVRLRPGRRGGVSPRRRCGRAARVYRCRRPGAGARGLGVGQPAAAGGRGSRRHLGAAPGSRGRGQQSGPARGGHRHLRGPGRGRRAGAPRGSAVRLPAVRAGAGVAHSAALPHRPRRRGRGGTGATGLVPPPPLRLITSPENPAGPRARAPDPPRRTSASARRRWPQSR